MEFLIAFPRTRRNPCYYHNEYVQRLCATSMYIVSVDTVYSRCLLCILVSLQMPPIRPYTAIHQDECRKDHH